MTRKLIFIFLTAAMVAIAVWSCRDDHKVNTKSSLEQSLDSAELFFISPRAGKTLTRIRYDIANSKDERIRIRGLRVSTAVWLSRNEPSRVELDSAALPARRAEKLALAIGDSLQWALCTIQLFRYENLRREWGFEKQKIGSKTRLLIALKIIERNNLTDDLSFGYRTLARSMFIDKDRITDVLNYELLSLEYNDSTRYPVLRARICNDLAIKYKESFNQHEIADQFYLRAINILKYSDDTLHYARVLANLADGMDDIPRAISYYRKAMQVLKSGRLPLEEVWIGFEMALRFQRVNKYDSAIFYLRKSNQKLLTIPGDPRKEILYHEARMARSFAGIGQIRKARWLMENREQIFNESDGFVFNLAPELTERIEACEALGDLKRLIDAQRRLMILQDSMYSSDQFIEVGKTENHYKLKLKSQELKNLQITSSLKAIAADRETSIRFLLMSVVGITTIGLLLVRMLLTRQKRLSAYLTHQNATIELQRADLEKGLQELQRVQAHILNSEKMAMLGQFTARVAHELNNPLNFVSGGVSVLEEAVEEANLELKSELQILRDIRNGVDRAMNIVKSLRVFSNPRSEIGFDSHSDVAECMNASLLVLQSRIRNEGIKVVCDIPESIVIGHSGQLCQVFINLIDNAIDAVKHLPQDRKTIEILARKNASHVSIDFIDCGTGVPEPLQPKLFAPFVTTKPSGQGIGLGLFICKTILQGIGGSISLTNGNEQKTTFTISLARPK